MNALIIVAIILLICLLLGQIPLMIGGAYREEVPSVWLKIGLIRINLLPSKEKKKQPTKEKKEKPKKESKNKMTIPQILNLVIDLLPVLERALGRLFGKLRMEEFLLLVTLAGEDDPATSAIRYGQLNGLLGAIWNPMVEMFHIQEGRAGVHVDFTKNKMELEAKGILSIKLGQLLTIVLSLLIQGLCIFLRHRRQNKLREAVS